MLILPINSKIFVYNIINNIFNEDDKNEIKNKKNILIPRNFNRDWIDDKSKSSVLINNKLNFNSMNASKNLICDNINITELYIPKAKGQNKKLNLNENYKNKDITVTLKNNDELLKINNLNNFKIMKKDKHKNDENITKIYIDHTNEMSKKMILMITIQ